MSRPSRKVVVGCVVVVGGCRGRRLRCHHLAAATARRPVHRQQPVASCGNGAGRPHHPDFAQRRDRCLDLRGQLRRHRHDRRCADRGTASVGTTVTRGHSLFSVAQRPTILLYGTVPAWREYTSTVPAGADIAELASNLVSDGLSRCRRRRHAADAGMTAAVKAWQHHLRVPASGRLRLGDVAFLPGPARVTDVSQAVGTQVAAGTALLTATSTALGATVAAGPGYGCVRADR